MVRMANEEVKGIINNIIEEKLYPDATIKDYLFIKTNFIHCLAIFDVISPSIINYRGGNFLENANKEIIDEMINRGEAMKDIELFANHIHLWDLVAENEYAGFEELSEYIGEQIADLWRIIIPNKIGKPVEVLFNNNSDDYGPIITFATI